MELLAKGLGLFPPAPRKLPGLIPDPLRTPRTSARPGLGLQSPGGLRAGTAERRLVHLGLGRGIGLVGGMGFGLLVAAGYVTLRYVALRCNVAGGAVAALGSPSRASRARVRLALTCGGVYVAHR